MENNESTYADESDMMDDESDAMNDDEYLRRAAIHKKGDRASVTAERWDRNSDWVAPIYIKTAEQTARIERAVSTCLLFQNVPNAALRELLGAFQEHRIGPDTVIVEEGQEVSSDDAGLFIIESGKLSVYKQQDNCKQKVGCYDKVGQSFGELALLYHCPRAATVVSIGDVVLWSIDRDTFNNLVKGYSLQQVQRSEQFLANVDLLKTLTDIERKVLADVLRPVAYQPGETIIREGDDGMEFFILEDGRVVAKKDGAVIREYTTGDYFGERALLNNEPRAAEITAVNSVKVLILDRLSFRRLLGPLDGILKQRIASYA
eukprot:GEMP01052172.1.p1 GENE.GEMP01052172.1~~GEMP01052172.1.p1  ORF type:complete len:318 (+),score=56.31 GEMP01052172.1:163-1116(+)